MVDAVSASSIIEIADSKFIGFVRRVSTKLEAEAFQKSLKKEHPTAAHVPFGFILSSTENEVGINGYDEDDEPPNSTGPSIVEEIRKLKQVGIAVFIVRYFGNRLLGVTCGRLSQCYGAVTRLALNRYILPENEPVEQEFLQVTDSLYGLAAGDTELILNVVEDPDGNMLDCVRDELDFSGFKGAKNEVLPRLQNLQASIGEGVVPVYRYPGNYHGDEWETFEWKPISQKITKAVEDSLLPLVNQKMNHCVTNYYRDGEDFIAHHSDKDLDLNQEGVIASVSLGDERIMELKRRAKPHDVTRVSLPHGSMLVLGPITNRLFTHSILKKEGTKVPRISLTIRDVKTFLDVPSGRLFGQGVQTKSIDEIRRESLIENSAVFLGFCAVSAALSSKKSAASTSRTDLRTGMLMAATAAALSFRLFRKAARKRQEEKAARDFFSKKSSSGTKY